MLFALSFAVQNSCPYGQAGKSPLLKRAGCHSCPLKTKHGAGDDSGTSSSKTAKKKPIPGPAFTFVPTPKLPASGPPQPVCAVLDDGPEFCPAIYPDLPPKPPRV